MNKVEIRDAIVQHLNVLTDLWDSQGRSVPVEMDNTETISLDKVGDLFIVFCIEWIATKQKNIAEKPDKRYYGDIVIMLLGKTGTGTRNRIALEDEISEHFEFKALGGVHTREPTPGVAPGRSEKHDGWHSITVTFPFFADSDT